MGKSLDELKGRLSSKYLGKAGIHGIGISRTHNAIRVYLQSGEGDEQENILKEIEKEAAPFKVLPVKSERPTTK
jgi:hypothetical protein